MRLHRHKAHMTLLAVVEAARREGMHDIAVYCGQVVNLDSLDPPASCLGCADGEVPA